MDYVKAVVIGILQGLTEFLPVSSSGHLVLAQRFFGLEPSLFLTVVLHMGSLIAVVAYYFRDIVALARRPFSKPVLLLVLATVPAVIAALFLDDVIEALFGGGMLWLGFLLTSGVLCAGEVFRARCAARPDVTARDAGIMGVAQALAIFPGLSRSGTTLMAGQFAGLSREAAARFSFLMSIPVILGSFVLEGYKALQAGALDVPVPMLLAGMAASAAASLAAIHGLLLLIRKRSLIGFAVWTLLMAAVAFIWL